jgi:hypothetical protein
MPRSGYFAGARGRRPVEGQIVVAIALELSTRLIRAPVPASCRVSPARGNAEAHQFAAPATIRDSGNALVHGAFALGAKRLVPPSYCGRTLTAAVAHESFAVSAIQRRLEAVEVAPAPTIEPLI